MPSGGKMATRAPQSPLTEPVMVDCLYVKQSLCNHLHLLLRLRRRIQIGSKRSARDARMAFDLKHPFCRNAFFNPTGDRRALNVEVCSQLRLAAPAFHELG
jgi:hypothetical protein